MSADYPLFELQRRLRIARIDADRA